jgi:hypothetical protein
VDAVVEQLQQLERQLPGGSARLLSEAMLLLSISDSPQLAKLVASARCIFGATTSGGAGPAAPPSAAAGALAGAPVAGLSAGPSCAPGAALPSNGRARRGAGASTATALMPGVDKGTAGTTGPDLGLLGNFLLGQWREDAARSAAAAARTRVAL